jgi:hypothetical protein
MSDGKLLELAERCEKAPTGSRDLNREIATALGFRRWDEAQKAWNGPWSEYTLSLDDASALVERVLPGLGFVLDTRLAKPTVEIIGYDPDVRGKWREAARAATPALALVAATLRALATGQDTSVGAVGGGGAMTREEAEERVRAILQEMPLYPNARTAIIDTVVSALLAAVEEERAACEAVADAALEEYSNSWAVDAIGAIKDAIASRPRKDAPAGGAGQEEGRGCQ